MLKISIIIPTYNRAEYLRQSVESALAQDYEHFEVIVSDNASTDETSRLQEIFKADERFKYFRNEENIGMVKNWRRALFEHATGDYFLLLSDDDYLIDNTYLTKAVKMINGNKDIVMVAANSVIFYEESKKELKTDLELAPVVDGREIFLNSKVSKDHGFCLCNILFNRKYALQLNVFDNEYNLSCDQSLFRKMCLYGKIGVIKDYVSVYRRHKKNISHQIRKDIKYIVHNNDAYIDPYHHAKEMNIFSNDELRKLERRIIPKVFRTLRNVYKYNPENYENALAMLREKDSYLLEETLKSNFLGIMFFKLKYSLIR